MSSYSCSGLIPEWSLRRRSEPEDMSGVAEKGRIAAIGMFDGVHTGHRAMLEVLSDEAATRGLVSMAVTFSSHPLDVIAPSRAPRLLMPMVERVESLRRMVDEVAVLDFDAHLRSMTACEFMAYLRDRYNVSVIYMGYNHRFGSDGLDSIDDYAAVAARLGMEVVRGDEAMAGECKVSSSRIRKLLEAGDVPGASLLLGYDYGLAGTVVHGKSLGRTIGFPTANVSADEERQIVPAPGVYACRAVMPDGLTYMAMVNIGRRPTVEAAGDVTIEAHLLDFDRDIYGQRLRIEFVKRMRDEMRFGSLEELREQLQRDVDTTRSVLRDRF